MDSNDHPNTNPQSLLPGPQQPTVGHRQAQGALDAASDDGESLDQEWVTKAKDIVDQTKSDPFTQSNELSKVKAGYLKARYNKDLKIGQDSP